MNITPELTAWKYKNKDITSLIAWCKYCIKYHWHGANGSDNGAGHRVAHCSLKTPYSNTGYELVPDGLIPLYIKKDLRLAHPKGPKGSSKQIKKLHCSTSFTYFIKKQSSRNDPFGDYALDFKYKLDKMPLYPECRDTDKINSETLYGHYCFLGNRGDHVLESLFGLWREWIEYKHIGLKYKKPSRGYVYVLKLKNKKDVFKIGRTQKLPEKRLLEVARQEKAQLTLHDWIEIDFFDIIEKELHAIFKKNQIMREWFEVDGKEINKAIYLYSLTDETCIVNSYQE